MKKCLLIALYLLSATSVFAQDTLVFKGQFSNWLLYSSEADLPIWGGSRYIPQLDYQVTFQNYRMLDFEASANIYGNVATNFEDTLYHVGDIKPYRLWARFSGEQFELRAGLQKINFGAASVFRPLMWFDQMDARDPLKLTDGVWGVLGRYYFLNNANVWLWTLYGNNKLRGWDVLPNNKKYPEAGGRVQLPLGIGEMGATFHYRVVDASTFNKGVDGLAKTAEQKYGLDLKFDQFIGWWIEASWTKHSSDQLGILRNQEMAALGMDYTFGVGNGLYAMVEHTVVAMSENAFDMSNAVQLSALTANYPIGLFDNIGLMFYYDWMNENVYSFVNWQKSYNKLSFHLMLFSNPKKSLLSAQNMNTALFNGKGVQLMLVYNH